MNANFQFYRHEGFTYVVVNGRHYKCANLDEAFELLQAMAEEMETTIKEDQ
jgi:predicted nucleic acid-binding Zn ribbon protein